MPLTSGRLRQDHDQKIRKNIRFIKENIDAKDLTDHFIEEQIFDFPDIDKINGYNPNTVENRNNCFLQLLNTSGPTAYDVFLQALRDNGQDFVADKIEGTEVNSNQEECGKLLWLQEISPDVRCKRLVERDLSKLAQAFGTEWELVMLTLGLSKNDVDHSKMDNPISTQMQIYSCLTKWKMRSAGDATLERFVALLASSESQSIDWSQMERICRNMTS